MFASHMPIAKLARSFQDLYCAYLDVVSEFSTSGKRKLAAVRMLLINGRGPAGFGNATWNGLGGITSSKASTIWPCRR